MLLTLPLFQRVVSIKGWFTIHEADLLIYTTLKAGINHPLPLNIVEVGSYMGRSTVLLGSIAKEFFKNAKVFAIDPHNGEVSKSDHDLLLIEPSLEMFNKNINDAGLSDTITLIKDYSFNIKWSAPISLLLIDGLHDYENVSRDFHHFAKWVRRGGYIAFHDFSNCFPGVMTFVEEILKSNNYEKVALIESLVVIQKNK